MQATISFTLFSLGLTGSTGNVFLMLKMILTKTAFTLTSQWQWWWWCWWCWRWWWYKRRRGEVGRLGPNLFLSSHISLQGISIHNRLNTAFVNNNCLWQAQATDTNYVFWVGEYFCLYNYYVQQGFPPLNVFANKLMFTSLWKTPFKTILHILIY